MLDQDKNHSSLWLLVTALCFAVLFGCYPEAPPSGNPINLGGSAGAASMPDSDAGLEAGLDAGAVGKCLPVSATAYPPRASIVANNVLPTQEAVYVSEVFDQFKAQCGACHVESNQGSFQVSSADYVATLQNPLILQRIQTDVLQDTMPQPSNIVYSQRAADDPVRRLVTLLQEWQTAGFPPDLFYEKISNSGQNLYALSADLGAALTNIGSCLPEKTFPFASDRATMMKLDTMFATVKQAPAGGDGAPEDKLGLPLDLADTDLTSFDSDVLAREGVIAFQPAYPLWSDDSGKLRYVRVPLGKSITFDAANQRFNIPDNTRFYKTFLKEVTDTQGNERWRKIETRLIVARGDLVNADGSRTPQALFGTYEWDESETHATLLIDTLRDGDPFTDHLFEYVTDEVKAAAIQAKKPANLTYEYEYAGIVRHYAVPGSTRCTQCHMGSSNGNFVIGFTPLQINRRPVGDGGVYESASADELTQLQRFIDLGVITGVKSASDIALLENSEGDRQPRNAQELKAQAYMLANCSHCHNPNGFPSVASPVLIPLLNFYPGKDSGIFQFPLERFSPRIAHGYDNSEIPYITPSMRDIVDPNLADYTLKYVPELLASPPTTRFLNAPWRSLIYRNVQTAFTYEDALTLYPHMPFNTAGHDCRASQWLGEWMVSIPAVRKHPEINENDYSATQDTEPQPYVEVLPDAPDYDAAVTAANLRLATYKSDPHYSTCPDNSDIVDPLVPSRYPYPIDTTGDGVPDHPNWVVTDPTEQKGLWEPRRTDWQDVLVNNMPSDPSSDPNAENVQAVVSILNPSVHLSDVAGTPSTPGFAAQPYPLALWEQKPGCNFAGQQTVSDLSGSPTRPLWFDKTQPDPKAPVFQVLPGQAVFDMICINCHGPNADSLGRQADTLQNLTGGLARVANFRYGLFNPGLFDDPNDSPDRGLLTNRDRVFGSVSSATVSSDDWGARYMAWMALGGTKVQLPSIILDQVRRTDVAGAVRQAAFNVDSTSANMLQVAQAACAAVAGQAGGGAVLQFDPVARLPKRDQSPLITINGDAELWTKLCSYDNPSPVHAITFDSDGNPLFGSLMYAPENYPATAPVGDDRGNIVVGLDSSNNYFPWCLAPQSDYVDINAYAQTYALNGQPLPICPAGLGAPWSLDFPDGQLAAWENRGAINAGLSVFYFLNQFITGKIPLHIGYDECEKLNTSN
jgi:mono/diheme cytochrome c family protein